MGMLWVILFSASTGLLLIQGLPVRPTPLVYPHGTNEAAVLEGWRPQGLYMLPVLALVVTALGLLFGCTWCYRHKDCKLFAPTASLHNARAPPDAVFPEPVNNNISEDNNNGPISLREMQNIANNNAAAYIVSENEERNRISRESVVEFEPLPADLRVIDPLERCADWFGGEDLSRNRLQYLREIGRGWFGRVVEGELDNTSTSVAVKILNQNASLEDKARFLDEARIYRDSRHENILAFVAKCLQEDPWILLFELCSVDLQQYLIVNRPKMAILNESGVPLQLMCDVSSALAYLHSRGMLYGTLWCGSVMVREGEPARAVLGQYGAARPPHDTAPHPAIHNTNSEVWSLGTLIWEICAWGAQPHATPPPLPDLPCPYRTHLYQVMQLCWNPVSEARPSAAQVHALLHHLHSTHAHAHAHGGQHDAAHDDGYGSSDFEERWQRLKPNSIPKIDEHVAIVHAPSTSMTSRFTSEQDIDHTHDTLSVDLDTAVSRSSSIMSDKDPLSIQIKSESLNNLHGSLEDVRNIYLIHNETAAIECHQGNVSLDDSKDKDYDRSDSSMDPWVKDIITGSQDDVRYYKDVSDVIKNLDNILNSEKTSSSESSHQASPSRDNLSLECKKDYPVQKSLVKSPGITNFQNILEVGFDSETNDACEDEGDRETIGTLSHSFERHSDTISQNTLENLTPDTPTNDLIDTKIICDAEIVQMVKKDDTEDNEASIVKSDLPNDKNHSLSEIPMLKELCVATMPSVNEIVQEEHVKDCRAPCDNKINDIIIEINDAETKSVNDITMDSEKNCNNETPTLTVITELEQKKDTEVPTLTVITELEQKKDMEVPTLAVITELEQKKDTEVPTLTVITELEQKKDTEVPTLAVITELEQKKDTEVPTLAVITELERKKDTEVPTLAVITEFEQKKDTEVPTLAVITELERKKDTEVPTLAVITELEQKKDTEVPTLAVITELERKKETEVPTLAVITELEQKKDTEVPTLAVITELERKKDTEVPTLAVITELEQKKETEVPTLAVITELERKKDTEVPTLAVITELERKKDTEVQNNINHEILPVSELESAEKDNITSLVINDSVHLEEVVNDVGKLNANTTIRSDEEIVIKDFASENAPKDLMNGIDHYSNDTTLHTYLETNGEINELVNIDTLNTTDSTIYLDLPSMIKETSSFLESEKVMSNQEKEFKEVASSTPKGSENSFDNQETSANECQFESTTDTKVPEYELGTTLTKLEQRCAPDNISPLESPTKSHHTDTYDENSSIVLGPFENCSLELFKAVKSEIVDLPKEELLAFSSNFSEMDLETPSPLRDGNFLNEVPDIMHDDLVFDDLATVSETKPSTEAQSDNTENSYEKSNTEKRISPSTPPNSPGVFLASTSQQKYLVDIDLTTPNESAPRTFTVTETAPPPFTPDSGLSSLQKEIDLNQIELQITTKLAMAENENNLNIEYSGPLTVEGFVTEDEVLMRESDAMPESYLAGNGIPLDDLREDLTLDTECVKALRDELELKLPLAQVAAIEPAECAGEAECLGEGVGEWRGELPPPPELVLSYPGALSPIAEETGMQLSAYENDTNWISARTESSESYPEPCNNSTDEVTELPTGAHNDQSTYTMHSKDNSLNLTYTVHKDVASSKEITMSADSLNASPLKKLKGEPLSPIDDRTYNKSDDEKQSNCERLSQVSPFLLSPTTDTSAPDNSDNLAGCSTLSKPTLPTDAKSSKPSETQCLSKATSIDSWCSNDTLYNVEENFDDLAMDPDVPLDFEENHELEKEDKSESTDTLTHNEQEKEFSHCSTYIIHDSKSEICETFSPDSITANFNTYTKPKTEAGATTSVQTRSELNDSTKNTQTKDLAYGTLMSGLPSGSNCSTELLSTADEVWKLSQPELVRRSPFRDEFNSSPSKSIVEDKEEDCSEINSPITKQPSINKMDSVDITCLKDNSDSDNKSVMDSQDINIGIDESQDQIKTIANSHATSTPLTEIVTSEDDIECIPINLPKINTGNSEYLTKNLPNFQSFLLSAEMRPQDISSSISNEVTSLNQDTEVLLEGESKSLSRNSKDTPSIPDGTLTYSDFEGSAVNKPQEIDSRETSRDMVTSDNIQDFRTSENSTPLWQQNLSSLIDASSSLLQNERRINEIIMQSTTVDNTNQSESLINFLDNQYIVNSPPSEVYLNESHINDINKSNIFITDLDTEEETEQPHSIIITESPLLVNRISPNVNRNYDSQTVAMSYDSNTGLFQPFNKDMIVEQKNVLENDRTVELEHATEDVCTNNSVNEPSNCLPKTDNEIKCNGSQNYATVSFLNEAFEELVESNVDDNERDLENDSVKEIENATSEVEKVENEEVSETHEENIYENLRQDEVNGVAEAEDETMTSVTENFLQNEKKYCTLDYYLPLMNDIRFTGPGAEIMSTSFNQDSSTDPTSPECEQDSKPDAVTDILKEWDSESDSHSTNSSSGEFIWRDGDGHDTRLVPSTHFQHHREGGAPQAQEGPELSELAERASSGSSGSSGSEGDEVEFVPSSWDCRAEPAKSSLRSLDHATPDSKKRVVFKRQKYHSVYEYPREVCEATVDAPPDLPDFSTYCDWEAGSAEEAELDYGQLFSEHNALDLYPLRAGIAFGADYDEDFFISSSTRPFEREFETLGVMSTASQFFPGMHAKQALLDRDIEDVEEFRAPPSPSPLPPTPLALTATPSLDFTTPDSGVEDITPGSTSTEDDFKTKKITDADACWRPVDSASSSESVSPSSPGGEALGGLRHTRDKLKLDLPPSPHIPSPRHNRVFNFVLDKPKRRSQEERPELGTTPLVMTDETPVITSTLPLRDDVPDDVIPEPTFSTFGKCASTSGAPEPEQRAIVLTDDVQHSDKEDSSNSTVEGVKGEGTVLDSGDEDSGIERSSKATLERNKTTPNVS